MVDENDFAKAKAVFKEDIAVLSADVAKARVWYKAYPFYAGMIAGALAVFAVRAVVHLL